MNTKDADDSATTDPAAAQPVLLVCTVLENGLVVSDCHHAAGKVMSIPEPQAKALADLGKVRIDGVA